jgi:hypothetical protein
MFTGTFAGHAAYYHPGDNPGYLSFAGWIPDRSASVVILANDASVENGGPAQAASAHRYRTIALAGLVAGTHDDEEE